MTGRVLPFQRVEGHVTELTDESLLAACASGDPAALGALFDRHHQAVYRFITRLGQAATDDVDDLVQTTFLTVQKSARRFRGRSAVLTWIFGIAVNVVRHEARGRGRRKRLAVALATQPVSRPEPPDAIAARRATLRRYQAALAALPEPLRVCFVLCQIEGVPGVEAARILGLRPGTLYRRIHDARRRLREHLGGAR